MTSIDSVLVMLRFDAYWNDMIAGAILLIVLIGDGRIREAMALIPALSEISQIPGARRRGPCWLFSCRKTGRAGVRRSDGQCRRTRRCCPFQGGKTMKSLDILKRWEAVLALLLGR